MTTPALAERRLAVQQVLSRTLGSASDVAAAAPSILGAIGESLGCDLGELWLVDENLGVLRCQGHWHSPEVDTGTFYEAAHDTRFRPGEGLPGRVWREGQPAWIADVIADVHFARPEEAERLGLHSAIAFPIQFAGEVLGCIQFFSRRVLAPDAALLALFADVGSQIGLFVQRARMQDTVVRQARDIVRLSTPILHVWPRVLAVPLIGSFEAERTEQLAQRLLERVAQSDTRCVLLDVTGVPSVDTATAQNLIGVVNSVRLLGAHVIMTGLRPALARTLVRIGVELTMDTYASLADGLRAAIAAHDPAAQPDPDGGPRR